MMRTLLAAMTIFTMVVHGSGSEFTQEYTEDALLNVRVPTAVPKNCASLRFEWKEMGIARWAGRQVHEDPTTENHDDCDVNGWASGLVIILVVLSFYCQYVDSVWKGLGSVLRGDKKQA